MARKIRTYIVDDLNGEPAVQTVQFSLDGNDYEIDLDAENAGRLRDVIGGYAGKARKVAAPHARKRKARGDLPDIRQYARDRGYDVKDVGRVPAHIVAEYDRIKAARTLA